MRRFQLPLIYLLASLAACSTQPPVRNWIDERTAVAITAQGKPLIFSREDFPAGVNIRDYAELGAFEVNRSGQRQLYLSLVLWTTLNRTAEQQAQIESAFAGLTIWADDQSIQLKRIAAKHEALSVGAPVFNLPSSDASESYYPVTLAQLRTMAAAHKLGLAPQQQAEGEQPYRPWKDTHASLTEFVEAVPHSSL